MRSFVPRSVNWDLAPAPIARKRDLLQRASSDLTGLPPGPALADQFIRQVISYEELVDSLLDRPSYGEHWAAKWLELARYADSRGYERDRVRSIWRYRDSVIRAHVHDVQATILALLGFDHERFTYPFQGRDFRLTDVGGRAIREVMG